MAAAAAKKLAPLGQWVSPITSELITSKVLRLSAPTVLASGDVLWLEARPAEKGRSVLVHRRARDGVVRDITPGPHSGINVRTRVHEYGGGEHLVTPDGGAAYFSNFMDQRVYAQALQPEPGAPAALTSAGSQQRFADYTLDAPRSRLIAVCEDHSREGQEPTNTIAAIDIATGAVTQLAAGHDFYSSPALGPGGRSLAFVAWDHPNMPWDDTQLLLLELGDGGLPRGEPRRVAGGPDESVQQPAWGPDGSLWWISDASGWWNLYRLQQPGDASSKAEPLLPMAAEFGSPPWVFGLHSYEVVAGGAAVLAIFGDPAAAGSQLGVIDTATARLTPLNTGFTSFGRLSVAGPGLKDVDGALTIVTAAGSATKPQAVVQLQVPNLAALASSGPGDWQTLKASSELGLDDGYLSEPRSIEFPTTGGLTAYMNFYEPKNKDFDFPPGHLPALLVKIHGGPTSQASTLLSLQMQFWTSRGFAIADVNYGGSTGYGRAFRNRLRGSWGVVDVDDCCAAAQHLVAQGLVDPARLCIDGGSAGGYTTLAALAFRNVFTAGASHYGVADVELLAKHTHKFESRYMDLLVGPYPQAREVYRERSPIHSVGTITAPVAIFQGDEDEIVPPEQAVVMHDALKAKGLPTTLMMYKGEQHGFRQAANIRSALEGELYFYSQVLGFDGSYSADLQPMTIDNAPAAAAAKEAAPAAKEEL